MSPISCLKLSCCENSVFLLKYFTLPDFSFWKYMFLCLSADALENLWTVVWSSLMLRSFEMLLIARMSLEEDLYQFVLDIFFPLDLVNQDILNLYVVERMELLLTELAYPELIVWSASKWLPGISCLILLEGLDLLRKYRQASLQADCMPLQRSFNSWWMLRTTSSRSLSCYFVGASFHAWFWIFFSYWHAYQKNSVLLLFSIVCCNHGDVEMTPFWLLACFGPYFGARSCANACHHGGI